MEWLYLVNCRTPIADVAGCQHLRSASQWKLIVPRYRLHSFSRRCFAVAGRRPGIRYLTVIATQHWVSTCLGVS